MNFFLKHKRTFTQYLLAVFMIGTVVVPAVSPLVSYASNIPTIQSQEEAEKMGFVDDNKPPQFSCFSVPPNVPGCLAMGSYYVLKITYWIAGWFSIFFNFALNELVMGMGNLVRQMTGIMIAWSAVRDITNVFLVFLTVYIGIATILGISGYGAKQLLWKVVVAALLVNFSVTFTKFVVDVSNIAAVQVFLMFDRSVVALDGSGGLTGCAQDTSATGVVADDNPCLNSGIAAAFWSQLKVTSIFNFQALIAEGNSSGAKETYWKMVYLFLMASVMFIVMAFVFGAAGFLLLARFVILIFLIIVSPLALVLWLTGVSGQGRAWWSALIKQSLFAPAILLTWWLAYVILYRYTEDFQTSMAVGGSASPTGISIVTMFIIVIGFLIAGLVVASKMGAYGANAIIKTGENWSRKAVGVVGAGTVGVVAGTTALAARQTLGRKAAADANNEKLKQKAATGNFLQRFNAKTQMALSKKIASSSFDARALTKSKYVGKAGGKGGYAGWAKEKVKETKELDKHIKEYKGTPKENRDLRKSLKKVDKQYKKDYKEINNDKETADKLDKAYQKEADAYRDKDRSSDPEQIAAANKRLDAAQKELKEIKDAHAKKLKDLENKRLTEKERIANKTREKYEEKGKLRSRQNLDKRSTERTAWVLPTPQWKKDAVAKIRREAGKTPLERKLEKALKDAEEEKTPPAGTGDTTTPPASSGDATTPNA